MANRVHYHKNLIYSEGTQVVALRSIIGPSGQTVHPRGAVGVVVRAPSDLNHGYRVRFPDGIEESLRRDEVVMLARFKEGSIEDEQNTIIQDLLFDRIIYRCIIGSRAYGLDDSASDTDYRGIFLPRAETHWSLAGVPGHIECDETQEHYWELQQFLVLALKANPNVLESLYTPLIEKATPLAEDLLAMKEHFLSRLVYQTFNGYVMSQFKKMQADLRQHGAVKWKHVMHLLRLLISGTHVLRHGIVPVSADEHREQLLAIKRGEVEWAETERWRHSLHIEFEQAFASTKLPDLPDYERANRFLVRARREALEEALP